MHFNWQLSRVICAIFVVMLIFSKDGAVYAQECTAPYETVTSLYHPEPGSFNVWESVYGEPQKHEAFHSVVEADENVIAVGELQVLDGVTPSLLMVKFDRKGRVIWNATQSVEGFQSVVKALPHDDGFVVLVNQKKTGKKSSVWYGVFDGNGKLKNSNVITDKYYDLNATDFIPMIADKGWAISVSASRKMDDKKGKFSQETASIYLVNKAGDEILSRSYILGKNSTISGLSVSKNEAGAYHYVTTGYYENNFGKKTGWFMLLNDDASLAWQQEFSRGYSANLTQSYTDNKGHLYVAGNIKSSLDGQQAAWLAKLDGGDGAILWQRYYAGEIAHYDYYADGLYIGDDGLITLMLSGRVNPERYEEPEAVLEIGGRELLPEDMDFAQVLLLSPRGITMGGDAYYYGQSAVVKQLLQGSKKHRVMVGYSVIRLSELEKEKAGFKRPEEPQNTPLVETDKINLPDAPLSDKAKKGLALLNKKIKEQDMHVEHDENKNESMQSDSAKNKDVTIDGWVVIGDSPEPYEDPCL